MLTVKQAEENQRKYGYNELVEKKRKSVFRIFLEQFLDFLVIVLIVAAIVSAALGDFESSIVILFVITMNAILGTVQTVKAENSLDALKKMAASEATVVRSGQTIKIPAREVTVGDEVVLEAGNSIPADGKLITCASLKADESALTGESLPVEKSLKETAPDAAIGDRTNYVHSGSFVTYGRATYEVTSIGMETEVGKIAGLLKAADEKKTPLQVSLDNFGRKLTILILIFCGLIFGATVLKGGNVGDAFLFAIALAVAAIPEALSSIVTIVLSFGTQKMAKEHAIVRKLQSVEGLGSVGVICSDKTGTLTQNKMTVEDYFVNGKRVPAKDIDLSFEEQRLLMTASILCNDAIVTEEQEIGDPTETALVAIANKYNVEAEDVREDYERISELPFDSDRKLMTTKHNIKGQNICIVKGAVDQMVGRVKEIFIAGEARPITADDLNNIEKVNEEFSRGGLRVLAFAFKRQDSNRELVPSDESELIFLGLIAMMDPPREESKLAVMECKRAGIKPVMITGDHKITAAAIAKRIGILEDESEACEGKVIETMTDDELKAFVPNISVYARVSPEHKIRIVKAWQDRGNIVAMTGDGVNDAPALKQADVGVAMGITGTEVSKDAAAMILTDDNFATIVKAVENGRNIYRNIKNAIRFLLSGNFGAILVVLVASLAALPVPFAAVQLLFINLLTDSLPAIALGLEKHSIDVMDEKPRPAEEGILTKKYLRAIGIEGLCIAVTTFISFLIGLSWGDAPVGMTMAFGTLCMGRLFHGFNCKSDKPVIFTKAFFDNPYLLGAFALGMALILSVLTIPGIRGLFMVVFIGWSEIFVITGLAFANLVIIQIIKFIRMTFEKRSAAKK